MNEVDETCCTIGQVGKTVAQLMAFLAPFAATSPDRRCATGQYALLMFVGLPLSLLSILILLSDFAALTEGDLPRPSSRLSLLRLIMGLAALCLVVVKALQA